MILSKREFGDQTNEFESNLASGGVGSRGSNDSFVALYFLHFHLLWFLSGQLFLHSESFGLQITLTSPLQKEKDFLPLILQLCL